MVAISGTLMNDTNGQTVTRSYLESLTTPLGTSTHMPIAHNFLLEMVMDKLEDIGFHVNQEQHLLDGEDQARYFGLLGMESRYEDRQVLVGLMNSHDKKFPARLLIGNRVFICSNTQWSANIAIARKHTPRILRDLPLMIEDALSKAVDVTKRDEIRVEAYKQAQLKNDAYVDRAIMGLFRNNAITSSQIGNVLREWEQPSHDTFLENGRSVWRLSNAVTEVTKAKSLNSLVTNVERTSNMTRYLDTVAERLAA